MRYLVLFVPLFFLSAGQVSAALSGRAIAAGAAPWNAYTLVTYLFLALRGGSWVLTVRYVPLSRAYPVMSLAYCLVPLLAALLLGETLDWRTLSGMALIGAGVALVGTGEPRARPV